MDPIEPAVLGHYMAILATLGPELADLERQVIERMSPFGIKEWLRDLSRLSVPDAATKIRRHLLG